MTTPSLASAAQNRQKGEEAPSAARIYCWWAAFYFFQLAGPQNVQACFIGACVHLAAWECWNAVPSGRPRLCAVPRGHPYPSSVPGGAAAPAFHCTWPVSPPPSPPDTWPSSIILSLSLRSLLSCLRPSSPVCVPSGIRIAGWQCEDPIPPLLLVWPSGYLATAIKDFLAPPRQDRCMRPARLELV